VLQMQAETTNQLVTNKLQQGHTQCRSSVDGVSTGPTALKACSRPRSQNSQNSQCYTEPFTTQSPSIHHLSQSGREQNVAMDLAQYDREYDTDEVSITSTVIDETGGIYDAEAILSEDQPTDGSEKLYLIKWENYPIHEYVCSGFCKKRTILISNLSAARGSQK
jgi:hypothetical protein